MTAASRASAVIDLDAIHHNLDVVQRRIGASVVMPIVKADAYGHGMVAVASALRSWGVEWLGVALPQEALELRNVGDTGRLLAWLWSPGDDDITECVERDVDLAVSSEWALREVVAAAEAVGRPARIHVKVDTGLTRNGVTMEDLPGLMDEVVRTQDVGLVDFVGLWSHLADGEVEASASVTKQERLFAQAGDMVRARGLRPQVMHLGNSGSAWTNAHWEFPLVRSGIALYGLTPGSSLGTSHELGIIPAMTLRARLANVKSVPAGTGVSYGGTWVSERATTVGLVPVGYADGIPRSAGGLLEVTVGGRRVPIVGRVAMDQFVIDLGPQSQEVPGDEVIIFGPGTQGELTADEWAARLGTIGYEIVTRIGPRVPREYVGGVG